MKEGQWKFDDIVASQFDVIARTHIPHYDEVIRKCVTIAESAFPDKLNSRIIDVGSATGYTMEQFKRSGYAHVFGVDNSPTMLERSRVKENLIRSDVFPKNGEPFHMVVANWTLHFIPDRESYIRDIRESLIDNGILILSEKMNSSEFVHDRYHDFKRSMGVSDEAIREKEAAIKGILVPYSLDWYQGTLKKQGFSTIEIIDSSWCFKTLLCTVK